MRVMVKVNTELNKVNKIVKHFSGNNSVDKGKSNHSNKLINQVN